VNWKRVVMTLVPFVAGVLLVALGGGENRIGEWIIACSIGSIIPASSYAFDRLSDPGRGGQGA
jgi:hypothetical protein